MIKATTEAKSGGTQRGFSWGIHTGKDEKKHTIIWKEAEAAPDLNKWSYKFERRGFFPFDNEVPRNGDEYYFYGHLGHDYDIKAWFDSQIASPETCEISMKLLDWQRKIQVEATTIKDGRIAKIRKFINDREDVLVQVAKIYKYFEKNCPAPKLEQNEESFVVSSVTQGIINSLKPGGLKEFSEWFGHVEEAAKKNYGMATSYKGTFTRFKGIAEIEFRFNTDARQILTKILFSNDAEYKEDMTGATLTLPSSMTIPASLIDGAKGMPLSSYLEIEGTELSIVRSARIKTDDLLKKEQAVFRSSVELEKIAIPEVSSYETEDEILSDIAALLDCKGSPVQTDQAIAAAMNMLEPAQMRSVLNRLKCGSQINLKDYGGYDIQIEMVYNNIRFCFGQPYPLKYDKLEKAEDTQK